MRYQIKTIHPHTVLLIDADNPPLSPNAADLLGEALGHQASWVVLPVSSLPAGFLQLGTGVAGEFIQKCVNYRVGLALVGSIEDALVRSQPLRDFVYESGKGTACWFVPDLAAFEHKLAAGGR